MSTRSHPFSPDEVMAYLDGEVTGERALAVADHLEGCAACAGLAAEFCTLSQQMLAWSAQASPVLSPLGHAVTPHGEAAGKPSRVAALLSIWRSAFQSHRILSLGSAFAALLVVALWSQVWYANRVTPDITKTLSPGRGTGPSIGPAPNSGLNITGERAPSNGVAAGGTDGVDNSANGVRQGIGTKQLNGRNYVDFTMANSRADREFSPAIRKTLSLSLTVKEIEAARAALEDIAKRHHGYFAELETEGQSEGGRSLTASLRVPVTGVESTVAELHKLGQVLEEKQAGEELTQQLQDVGARLANSRRTEKRLTDLLVRRGDKLKDVLDVERELASTREEIERLEAEERNMTTQVEYAAIDLNLREDYKPALGLVPPAAGKRLRNALVEGYRRAAESGMNLLVSGLHYGPTVILWVVVLLFPARQVWRRIRALQVQALAGTV
jgi:hypothetical protein